MVIDISLVAFLLIYFILCLLLFLIMRLNDKNRYVLMMLILFYILILIKLVFMPIHIYDSDILCKQTNSISLYNMIQLHPFKTILEVINVGTWKMQIIGNIVLLSPIPLFYYIIKHGKGRIIVPIVIGIVISLSIESLQLMIDLIIKYPSKIFDIDDLLLNVLGVVASAIICKVALHNQKVLLEFNKL